MMVMACAPKEELHCDDLLPRKEVSYQKLSTLMQDSCSRCHNTDTPVYGYNFEGKAVSYDALSSKMQAIYSQVASGEMPEDGPAWTQKQVQHLRSWYCYGAFYEE